MTTDRRAVITDTLLAPRWRPPAWLACLALVGPLLGLHAYVLSTLLIAAVAAPLHRRLHSVNDRRFHRRHYDAVRTLADFGATLRDNVDLDQLSTRLVSVVDDTMQPDRVSLWIKP